MTLEKVIIFWNHLILNWKIDIRHWCVIWSHCSYCYWVEWYIFFFIKTVSYGEMYSHITTYNNTIDEIFVLRKINNAILDSDSIIRIYSYSFPQKIISSILKYYLIILSQMTIITEPSMMYSQIKISLISIILIF